ncbi:hypothetical protein GGR55DRAFT_124883 [Xylaria sp. FL0064]|nr:hypothetical protein GGR55DRAFT_124883 [Xylaria sp. FL0064]
MKKAVPFGYRLMVSVSGDCMDPESPVRYLLVVCTTYTDTVLRYVVVRQAFLTVFFHLVICPVCLVSGERRQGAKLARGKLARLVRAGSIWLIHDGIVGAFSPVLPRLLCLPACHMSSLDGEMRWPWVWLVPGSRPLVHTTPVLGVASGRVSPNRLGWAVVHRPNKNDQDGSNQGLP